MDKTRELFSRNIFMRREELGLNQDEVAHRLGINPRTYQKYEYGQAFPRPDKMAKLAEIFGVSPASLMGGPESSSAPASSDRASRILAIQARINALTDEQLAHVEDAIEQIEGIREVIHRARPEAK